MSESTTSHRRWLRLGTVVYVAVVVVVGFSGLADGFVPQRLMTLFPLAGAALTIFAFRDPSRIRGWRIVPVLAAIVALGLYNVFLR
jgi:hypothetical protein